MPTQLSLCSIGRSRLALWLALLCAPLLVIAAPADNPRQDLSSLQRTIEQFMQVQTTGLPGEVQVNISPIDKRLNLAECAAPQVFMPPGSKAWGKTTVGVRCASPVNWTVYVQAQVKVMGDYLVSALPLAQGSVIGPNDLSKTRGDLSSLPPGILTEAQQAIGRSLSLSLPAGAAVRQDMLRSQPVVQQGQSVRVVTSGTGFQVAVDGRALGNAMDGQVVQARTASGQVVSGLARAGGLVEVTY